MSIVENLKNLRNELPQGVKLVAVSKSKPMDDILEAYHSGHRIFGENRPQELIQKYASLPKDIEWHFIGHMQTNKVKFIVPFVSLIHSVDSLKLLQEIDKEAIKNQRIISCLLEFRIADEETKYGFSYDEARKMLQTDDFQKLQHISIKGVMGIATFTPDEEKISDEFKNLKQIFNSLKNDFFRTDDSFREISMGMSGDYNIAVQQGSTIVRIGSNIFGSR